MDESTGTIIKDHIGNNHGTLGDGSTSSTFPTLTSTGFDGKENGALNFDGGDYIT